MADNDASVVPIIPAPPVAHRRARGGGPLPWVVAAIVGAVAIGLGAYFALRSPEDARRSPYNPAPAGDQLAPNEYVERARRIHQNDGENVPLFLAAGLLFVLAAPPLWAAQLALYGYVATRLLHFAAYVTAQLHDVRAALWTPGSLAILAMAGYTLARAIDA